VTGVATKKLDNSISDAAAAVLRSILSVVRFAMQGVKLDDYRAR
jgi:hypothetical protein